MRKLFLLFAAAILVFSTVPAIGQNLLSASRQSSAELFVYKLTAKDAKALYLEGKGLDESMLHTFVLSCPSANDIPDLPRGNYITVRAVGNMLQYSGHTVDNFYHRIVRDEMVMLFLSDTLGNVIADATVKCKAKRLKFDPATQTYNTKSMKNEQIVEVDNDGVLHYIEFEDNSYRYYYRPKTFSRNWWRQSWDGIRNSYRTLVTPKHNGKQYEGFVVFSKPKYKPWETVKFKAYIHRDGKPYNKEAEVSLVSRNYYSERLDTIMTTLKPYRQGMYEWEFRLSDSLKVRLDTDYEVVLRTKEQLKNRNDSRGIRSGFRYGEYELGRITFDASIDRYRYTKRDTVKLRFDARDENGMPVYDGRVDITVNADDRLYDYTDSAFITDEIWKHSFSMTGKGSDEVVLPDSIFVAGVSTRYYINCSFFDAGNEKHTKSIPFFMDMRDRMIDLVATNGMLSVVELFDGDSVATKALLTAYNEEGNEVYRDSVMLPHTMPLIWLAENYKVSTATCDNDFHTANIREHIMSYRFFREDGQVKLSVDNPAGIPFWFTVRKGEKTIDKGYVSQLERSYEESAKEGYTMQLSYLLGEQTKTIEGSLPYSEQNLTMDVSTATTVYPGQTAAVTVSVKDSKGQPVRNADITAYAVTSKFGMQMHNVPVYSKSAYAKKFTNKQYSADMVLPRNAYTGMDWELWRERMGLDSIEYYKFLYPEPYYYKTENVKGTVTQISPYVVIDGALQGVHILWIDGQPHYFHGAGQMNVYSFPVAAGYHTLRFRTYDRDITVDNVYVHNGRKTIFSVNGAKSTLAGNMIETNNKPMAITVTEYDENSRGILSAREMASLQKHMITVDNNFGMAYFKNHYSAIGMPAMIKAGGVYYCLSNMQARWYNHKYPSYDRNPILAGPFPYNGFRTGGKNIGMLYVDTAFVAGFEIEGGYHYTIRKQYTKLRKWGQNPINRNIAAFTPNVWFDERALTYNDIIKKYRNTLLDKVADMSGPVLSVKTDVAEGCNLNLTIGNFKDTSQRAEPVLIRLAGTDNGNSFESIYYGSTDDFNNLPEGNYNIDLIFRDSTRYSTMAALRKNGQNYLKIDSIVPLPADTISRRAFDVLHSQLQVYTPQNNYASSKQIISVNQSLVFSETDEEIIELDTVYSEEEIIEEESIYVQSQVSGRSGSSDEGAASNIMLHGIGSLNPGNSPLFIVDGVPSSSSVLQRLSSHEILSIDVLKDASATSIYGARAANGVIYISTKKGAGEMLPVQTNGGDEFPDGWDSANSLRTNFHDDAFWQPRLTTGKDGSVTFNVTYPDDITAWSANFIAVGGRKQTDRKLLTVRSFKPINAQLLIPQFAVLGDSLNVVGRLTNHLGDTVAVARSIELQGRTSEEGITLTKSYVDTIPVVAASPDSIAITYSLKMDNGYFDGERRSIPVYKRGVLETHGEFAVLGDSTQMTLCMNPSLGEVTLHAEASAMQSFLNEIEVLDRYPYLCNEQMASKVKALILKKRISAMLGMEFKDDSNIKDLIGRLEKNKNGDNLWGWWNQDKTELWISKQIIEAMLEANTEGYKTTFNNELVEDALIDELHGRMASLPRGKHELFDILGLLEKLGTKIDYARYTAFVSSLPDTSLNDRLRSVEMMQTFGEVDSITVRSLLGLASETMMGSMYWSEKEASGTGARRFLLPHINNTDNTLTAYRILRKAGGYEKELEKIRNYFFEMRKSGSWPNTYESSRIMETILPDMLGPEGGYSDAALTVNGKRFGQFPMTATLSASETLDIKKEGTAPIFFTAYQQAWNETPERAAEGFSIETAFYANGTQATVLNSGKSVELKVNVTSDSDAEYVMIEVPIPAGCSYESKDRGSYRETHREYHKEKVAIFCNRLSKGTHEFTVKLLPRYTGTYHLNPAKVELMYYPTFFGRGSADISEIR